MLAAQAGAALGNLQRYEDVVAASLTDALTGLPNHRRFHEDGAALLEAARATRRASPSWSATWTTSRTSTTGAATWPVTTRCTWSALLPTACGRTTAPTGSAARSSAAAAGDDKTNARTVCRRLQRALAAVDLDGWRLSVSIGVASFPQDGETLRDLLVAGDAALYEAKRMGKDRITMAEERLSARRLRGDTMPRAAGARSSRCAPSRP